MGKRTVAKLSAFSRYHLDQITLDTWNAPRTYSPTFNLDRSANIEAGKGDASDLANIQKNPRERRAPGIYQASDKWQKAETLQHRHLIDDVDRINEDTSGGSTEATIPTATSPSQQSSSQCDIFESEGFKKLPQGLLNMIWWEYLQTPPGHRVWVYDTAFSQNGALQFGFGARAPLPRVMCANNFYRRKAFRELGFVEIKRKASDPEGLILDPLRDLIFLDQSTGIAATDLQLEAFVAAMKRCNALDKLRSISIGHQLVSAPLLQKTVSLLYEFCNLELILVAYNKRPRPSKSSASRGEFTISDVLDDYVIRKKADENKQAMEDAWICRPGSLVPHIAHIEYRGDLLPSIYY